MRIGSGTTGFILSSALILWMASLAEAQGQLLRDAPKKGARASEAEINKNIDRSWVKKAFLNDMMEHWVTASVMPNGFIQENLDREWKPWGTQREASLNGQGRVLYTLAIAYEVSGGDKRYPDAMTKCSRLSPENAR